MKNKWVNPEEILDWVKAEWGLKEIIEHFGEDDILDEIGIQKSVGYWRDSDVLDEIGKETCKEHFDLVEEGYESDNETLTREDKVEL